MNPLSVIRSIIVCTLLLLSYSNTQAQSQRVVAGINDNWKFHQGGLEYADNPDFNDSKWQLITLPHTWNATDPFDDDETYFRGISWYRKDLELNPSFKNKKVFLFFEGANQVTDVYVNGAFAGQHKGGYTAFSIDITPYLNWKENAGKNTIAIQVNNAHDNFIPPLSVGYALYGGIYRNMWLIATDDLHFKEINNSAGSVFITTPNVNKQASGLSVKTTVVNESNEKKTFIFLNTVFDKEGKKVVGFSKRISLEAGGQTDISASSEIANLRLWSPEDPYLYEVHSQLIENNKVIDEVKNPLGFRWFRFDADSGFFLNGKKYVLHGTNRHQDMEGKGSALSNEDHIRDMYLIKDMGANFVRLAHYPQAPEVLKLADQLGIIIWEEIPVVNYMNIDPEFLANAENMLREMIHQQFNHPAIVMWGSMNEILLHSENGDRIPRHTDDSDYVRGIRKYAVKLDSLIRAEDPTRYTTMAMHGSKDYAKYNLDNISQVAGHNIYEGWYGGKVEQFGTWLDKQHKEKPDQIIVISEYGAGSDRRLNSSNPERLDFTGQYQRYYHESYIRQMNARPFLAGTAIWNEFDFSQPNIGGPMSNLNNKGMMTWDRKYKDVYFLYKANWNPDPMVYIATRDWLRRAGNPDTRFDMDVYANTNDVKLYVNGKLQGTKKTDDIHKTTFSVQLNDGDNLIEAGGKENGKEIKDVVTIHYTSYPEQLSSSTKPFSAIYINVGSNAQYTDESGFTWLQDQPYKKGGYGYVSGLPKTMNLKYMIKNTENTPLYYSYLDSVTKYKVDVPDGEYEVSLYFIEVDKLKKGDRIFDVIINNTKVLTDMDLTADYGFCNAVKKSFIIKVQNGEGVIVSFDAKKGNPVFNAIKLTKKY